MAIASTARRRRIRRPRRAWPSAWGSVGRSWRRGCNSSCSSGEVGTKCFKCIGPWVRLPSQKVMFSQIDSIPVQAPLFDRDFLNFTHSLKPLQLSNVRSPFPPFKSPQNSRPKGCLSVRSMRGPSMGNGHS